MVWVGPIFLRSRCCQCNCSWAHISDWAKKITNELPKNRSGLTVHLVWPSKTTGWPNFSDLWTNCVFCPSPVVLTSSAITKHPWAMEKYWRFTSFSIFHFSCEMCAAKMRLLRSLLLSYQKNNWWSGPCQSFFCMVGRAGQGFLWGVPKSGRRF